MSSPAPRRSVDKFESPFTSPASNQYPFPQTGSPQSPESSRRHGRRRGSTASSITSIGGILDTAIQNRDTIAEASNNAIASLLQPPIVRTGHVPYASAPSSQKLPSAKDIPPVTLTNIPHIEPSAFLPYLKQAGSLYDAFQRAKEGDGAGSSRRRSRASSKTDQLSGILNQAHTRQGSISKVQMPGSIVASLGSPPERPQTKRKTSGGLSRRGPLTVAPLSTIPPVYFEQNFHLENPRTFDIVSEKSEIVRPPPGTNGTVTAPGQGGRKALATNAILQEKLSWYMDTVEVHLISSISSASSSFFAALGSLRDLHLEASDSVTKIKKLREDLASLDQNMAVGGLKIVAMRRRRENMRKLGDAVQQLRKVVEAVSRCEEQVDGGELEEALRGLVEVEDLIAGQRKQPISSGKDLAIPQERLVDLRALKALEGAGNDIAYLRHRIGKSFETRFLETLVSDLRSHVDSTHLDTTFQRWDKASNRSRSTHVRTPSVYPTYLQIDEPLRAALRTNLDGLAHSDSLKPATSAYREAVWKEVKTLIRRHLPSSSDDDNESTMSGSTQGGRHMTQQEKSTVLAHNLRALEAEDAEKMLKKIYSNVGEALRRLGTQVKVVLDITSSFDGGAAVRGAKSPMSPPIANMDSYMNGAPIKPTGRGSVQQEDIQQTLDMTNLLGQAVDIAQNQITKILKVRAEQSVRLSLPHFLQYFHLNRLFADECEAVSGRGGMALKTVVNTHIKEFVHYAGDTERQRLVQGMDADRWDAKDFTDNDNQLLSQLIDASTKDIETWTNATTIWSDRAPSINGDQQTNGIVANGTPPKDKFRSATIDEQKFILPESALIVLGGIGQFEQLITGIPSMTQEITSLLLEYLKLFNSRSSQLILGAGATRSANLKNITTKHLALASQALSFVTALKPYVREFVRRHSPGAGSLMVEFDKVKRLYQEHQSGINDKLVDIMSGRATTHVNTMKKIDWDKPADNPGVNLYMETLVKETSTLHKVLSKHMPEMTVQTIMNPVFSSYREQWGKAFSETNVKTVAGKERMLRDAEFFKSRISKLEGAADLGDSIVNIVSSKSVAENPKSSQSTAASPKKPAEKPQLVGEKT
ncbi:vacuolar protein sorting-associated protein 54, partial [Lecanoromycetidae sp. Uapishka_2]